MAIQETRQPYELLARWRDGSLAGAHVQFLDSVIDGERILLERISEAMPVDVGAGKGFPVADLLGQLHVDALAALDAKTLALATAVSERETLQGQLATAQQALEAVQAELDALKAGQAPIVNGVPQVVTRFQARAALHLAGLLDTIEAMMAAPDVDRLAKLAWADAQTFERQSPTLLMLAGALNLTSEQVDALFVQASAIQA